MRSFDLFPYALETLEPAWSQSGWATRVINLASLARNRAPWVLDDMNDGLLEPPWPLSVPEYNGVGDVVR